MEAAEDYRRRVEEARDFIVSRAGEIPGLVMILGTGLGDMAARLDDPVVIPYGEIPNFPRSTVESHSGNLVIGRLAGCRAAVLQGRFHYYEGYSTRELTLPLRSLAVGGARTLVVSNAAGGLNPDFLPGTLMIITDHINFIPDNPLRGPNVDEWGPRFPDMSAAYTPELSAAAMAAGIRAGVAHLEYGTYCAIPGPSLETPAETRFLRQAGADAVGMSTVPEVIVAVHSGMRVLGISVVSNVNDPDNFVPIMIDDIIARSREAAADLERLLLELVPELCGDGVDDSFTES